MRLLVLCCLLTVGGVLFTGRESSASGEQIPEVISGAPPNEWVKIHESETGGRSAPVWTWVPDLDRFVLTSGSGGWPLHWDNEEFDLASGKFVNAYPRGAPENYAPAEGPTRVEDMPKQGYSKREFWQDAAGFWRIPWFASYGDSSQAYHQYAYDPEVKRLITYIRNQTFAFNVHARKWSDKHDMDFLSSHGFPRPRRRNLAECHRVAGGPRIPHAPGCP
jgi:hypothetical protein